MSKIRSHCNRLGEDKTAPFVIWGERLRKSATMSH